MASGQPGKSVPEDHVVAKVYEGSHLMRHKLAGLHPRRLAVLYSRAANHIRKSATPLGMFLCCALLSSLCACTGPRMSEVYAQQQDESRSVVRIWERRLRNWQEPFAVHLVITLRSQDDPPGAYEEWEIVTWKTFLVDDSPYGYVVRSEVNRDEPCVTEPTLVDELRGPQADEAIACIREHASNYANQDRYSLGPGPTAIPSWPR